VSLSGLGAWLTDPAWGTFTQGGGTVANPTAETEDCRRNVNWTSDVEMIADVDAAETTMHMERNYEIAALYGESPASDGASSPAQPTAPQWKKKHRFCVSSENGIFLSSGLKEVTKCNV
jgi:hypothetical protein